MPNIIYTLRFIHRGTNELEVREYTDKAFAWETFQLFAEPASAEIYTGISLTEHDYSTPGIKFLAGLLFTD